MSTLTSPNAWEQMEISKIISYDSFRSELNSFEVAKDSENNKIKNKYLIFTIMMIGILVAILPIGYFTIRYHDFIYGYKIKNSQIKFLKEEKESQFEGISNEELIKKSTIFQKSYLTSTFGLTSIINVALGLLITYFFSTYIYHNNYLGVIIFFIAYTGFHSFIKQEYLFMDIEDI